MKPLVEAQLIGDPVDEQNPIEVVQFVLDAAGQKAVGAQLLGPPNLIAKAHLHHGRAHHIEIDPGNAEAALLVGVNARPEAGDLGVDQHHRRRGGIFRIEIDHQQLLMYAHLGGRQANAASGIHAAQHVAGQFPHRLIHLADPPGGLAQHLVAQGGDGEGRVVDHLFRHLYAAAHLLGAAGHLSEAARQGLT